MMTISSAFDPLPALAGGALIGLAASMLLLLNGRVAGISGIVGGLRIGAREESAWRVAFVLGLGIVGLVAGFALPAAFDGPREVPAAVLLAAGLLVGIGTRVGNGCTSGHGVCGMSRFAVRSLTATLTFMATAAVTVFLVRHGFGGGW